MDDLTSHMLHLYQRVQSLEQREAGSQRPGTVAEVSADGARYRVRIGGTDAEPYLSPWIPQAQSAGALKGHTPATVGQQVQVLAPAGDLRRAFFVPFTWSDANAAPSNSATENVWTFGQFRAELRSGEYVVTVPKFRITGDVEITGDMTLTGNADFAGGRVTSNGHRIDGTHKHHGIQRGSARTDPPE